MGSFDFIAPDWNLKRSRPSKTLAFVLPKLNAKFSVLDAGCGNARNAVEIAKRVHEVVGVDISREMIAFSKANALSLKEKNCSFLLADYSKTLPFRARFFDCVLCFASFHHLKTSLKRLSALKQFRFLLKKKGFLFGTVWSPFHSSLKKKEIFPNRFGNALVSWKFGKVEEKRFYHFFSKNELELLLKKAGFSRSIIFFEAQGRKCAERDSENICFFAFP